MYEKMSLSDETEVKALGFHIVLYQPEIPYNTGNIARTCAATNTKLHIIRPMGFKTDDKMLKRAGCDYWHSVDITYYDSMDECFAQYPEHRFFFVETEGKKNYTEVEYREGDFFVFGRETTGIPTSILDRHQETWIKIPMSTENVRSLNLSNTAAILVYEALRQIDFPRLT
jgi:tRNA (cytidine/uridine-2'-O-)-methyltransferase